MTRTIKLLIIIDDIDDNTPTADDIVVFLQASFIEDKAKVTMETEYDE